jgi:hypothetical protein
MNVLNLLFAQRGSTFHLRMERVHQQAIECALREGRLVRAELEAEVLPVERRARCVCRCGRTWARITKRARPARIRWSN